MRRPQDGIHGFTLALLLLIVMLLAGCEASSKMTWQDWMTDRDAAEVTSTRRSAVASASAGEFVSAIGKRPSIDPATAAPLRLAPPYKEGDAAAVGPGFDLAMRNPDFPSTYIAEIHVDVTSPDHFVRLVWTGPAAERAPSGPWHSNIGRGNPGMNCDDVAQSNIVDSRCTPKGTFFVAGFADQLNACPTAHYCTWVVHAPRYVALHSHGDIPNYPVSAGCVRLTNEVAKLIHNNSIAGVTLIHIGGRWTNPELLKP